MSDPDRIRIADLPTAADLNSRPRACPKPASRVVEKATKDKSQDKAWEECKRQVWLRDQSKCRCCGRVVVRSLELRPERGEVHHIAGRRKAVMTDPRSCLLVCAHPCHEALTHHELAIIGTAKQTFKGEDGKTYLDASQPLQFIKKEIA